MARSHFAALQHVLHILRQIQKPQCIRDRRAGFAHCFCNLLLRELEVIHQHLVAVCFFQRLQILTLQVLNQRQLHHFAVRQVADNRRYGRQPCHARSTPASLTRNDLIAAGKQWAHQDRLQNAVLRNRIRQFGHRAVIKALARLRTVRL